jgi:hypothetical protein
MRMVGQGKKSWRVTAGVIPGHEDHSYRKQWIYEEGSFDKGLKEAQDYATSLMREDSPLKWVNLEWLWY